MTCHAPQGLPLLAAMLLASQAAAQQPLQSAGTGIIDPAAAEVLALEEEANRRLTVQVHIDGNGPYDFMIDTGSQATAVTREIHEGLRLRPAGTAMLVGMASRRAVDLVEVTRLDIGSHTITDLAAPVLDRENIGADGIVGLDSLQDLRVMIDFRDRTIALEDVRGKNARNRGFEIVVRAREQLGQLLITDALVEGIRATVIIDTGAQTSLANNALRERIRTKRAAEVTTTDVNGVDLIGQMSLMRSVTIEGLSLTNIPLTFADAPAFDALGLSETPALSLGMQHLALFDRVAIDFANRRVLFDVPRDVARAIRENRSKGYLRSF
ncbi:aspartyl protease family protein [Erythrobacter dokdonensis]|uniref:Peptidase A2A, retrovirus, catalytic n=1 Tax=Erythrobacter dokdonensis DSW-74 TaxID=1300349 RepID=A0A1A7BFF4_9SPHN|nr:aspartyl protease family protein [Erythrobacter dokdonensis]OBV11253.1 Peptidase A2A, retrovirus, catalytic [Erythrobacter dokdonensis DSW-74]